MDIDLLYAKMSEYLETLSVEKNVTYTGSEKKFSGFILQGFLTWLENN